MAPVRPASRPVPARQHRSPRGPPPEPTPARPRLHSVALAPAPAGVRAASAAVYRRVAPWRSWKRPRRHPPPSGCPHAKVPHPRERGSPLRHPVSVPPDSYEHPLDPTVTWRCPGSGPHIDHGSSIDPTGTRITTLLRQPCTHRHPVSTPSPPMPAGTPSQPPRQSPSPPVEEVYKTTRATTHTPASEDPSQKSKVDATQAALVQPRTLDVMQEVHESPVRTDVQSEACPISRTPRRVGMSANPSPRALPYGGVLPGARAGVRQGGLLRAWPG